MKKMIAFLLSSVFFALGCAGCNSQESIPSVSTAAPDKISRHIGSMTLEEKVGQLFIVRPEAVEATAVKCPVGGVVLFAEHIQTPEQAASYIKELQAASEIPLFIAVDEEGGRVARIANNENFTVKKYESMKDVGASGDVTDAEEAGRTIGGYLSEYGFNLDFAPVADVNSNPDNVVIGNRSFGSNPELVSGMVNAAISGFHSRNIMTCVKHYPGHGDTNGDTHTGYVSVDKTWEELLECELIPFKGAISAGTDMIMVAHVTVPKVTENDVPASVSYELITEKLRGELSYDGVVITDAMEMGAITEEYSSEEATVLALKAGVDIVLMPENFEEAYIAVCDAVKSGELSEKELDLHVRRVLALKNKYGVINS